MWGNSNLEQRSAILWASTKSQRGIGFTGLERTESVLREMFISMRTRRYSLRKLQLRGEMMTHSPTQNILTHPTPLKTLQNPHDLSKIHQTHQMRHANPKTSKTCLKFTQKCTKHH